MQLSTVPKLIVNEVLGEGEFPRQVFGIEFERLAFLLALCGALLSLIILNNGLKYFINVRKGLTGERMLRRMRFEFFTRIVKRPVSALKSHRPVEMVQAIVAELEPIGAFIGEIVATPIYQGGHLLVYLGFILMQDPLLGLAAIILFPIQAYVIPIVQKRVVAHVQERIVQVRRLSSELNDSLSSVEEMRLNGSTAFHEAQISSRLYTIFTIRYRIYILKFAVKFANNVINHLVPFFFYAFGGYLVLQGRMDLGALVAILAAYKDIASPWKELLRYYQTYSDITARYTTSVESFATGNSARTYEPRQFDSKSLSVEGVATELSPENGGFSNVSLELPSGSLTFITGPDDGGRELLVRVIAGLEPPTRGGFKLGGERLNADEIVSLNEEMSFVARSPLVLTDTLYNNLAYGILADRAKGEKPSDWSAREKEARLTGTIPDDPGMDWTNYERANVSDEDQLMEEIVKVLRIVGLEEVVFANGLAHRCNENDAPELRQELLQVRSQLADLEELPGKALVELFDRDSFMVNATLFENLFFGCWDTPISGRQALAKRRDLKRAIKKLGIEEELVSWGLEAARILAELLAGVTQSPAILERIDLVSPEDLERLESVVSKATARGVEKLKAEDRWFLIGLALDLRPIRHRLGVLDPDDRKARIVELRKQAPKLEGFTSFDSEGYIPGLTAIENIMIARPRLDRRDAKVSIEDVLHEQIGDGKSRLAIVSAGLLETISSASNEFTSGHKRALALARGLLRRPKLLIIEALPNTRRERAQPLVRILRQYYPEMTMVIAYPDSDSIEDFDHAIRIDHGEVSHIEETSNTKGIHE